MLGGWTSESGDLGDACDVLDFVSEQRLWVEYSKAASVADEGLVLNSGEQVSPHETTFY